jgi:hypothetical protein
LLPPRQPWACQKSRAHKNQHNDHSGPQQKGITERGLWSGAHQDQSEFPSYTIPQWIPTRNQPLPHALQMPHRHSICADHNFRAGAACKSP